MTAFLITLAIVIALVALVLAIKAFNRVEEQRSRPNPRYRSHLTEDKVRALIAEQAAQDVRKNRSAGASAPARRTRKSGGSSGGSRGDSGLTGGFFFGGFGDGGGGSDTGGISCD